MRVTVIRNPVDGVDTVGLMESWRPSLLAAMQTGRQSGDVYRTLAELSLDWAHEIGKPSIVGDVQSVLVPIWDNAVLMDFHGDALIDNFISESRMRTMRYAGSNYSGANHYSGTTPATEPPKKFTGEEQNNLHFLYSGILIAVVGLAAFLFNYAGKS